jgi:hypothetical protein
LDANPNVAANRAAAAKRRDEQLAQRRSIAEQKQRELAKWRKDNPGKPFRPIPKDVVIPSSDARPVQEPAPQAPGSVSDLFRKSTPSVPETPVAMPKTMLGMTAETSPVPYNYSDPDKYKRESGQGGLFTHSNPTSSVAAPITNLTDGDMSVDYRQQQAQMRAEAEQSAAETQKMQSDVVSSWQTDPTLSSIASTVSKLPSFFPKQPSATPPVSGAPPVIPDATPILQQPLEAAASSSAPVVQVPNTSVAQNIPVTTTPSAVPPITPPVALPTAPTDLTKKTSMLNLGGIARISPTVKKFLFD